MKKKIFGKGENPQPYPGSETETLALVFLRMFTNKKKINKKVTFRLRKNKFTDKSYILINLIFTMVSSVHQTVMTNETIETKHKYNSYN